MASIVLPEGIQLLSGAEATRTSKIPDVGEPMFTTDQRRLYFGDNATPGGNEIAYIRRNFVDEVPVVATVPDTPAAGHVTEDYYRDGYWRWKDSAGVEHLKNGPVPAESRVAPGFVPAPFEQLTIETSAAGVTVTAAQISFLSQGNNFDGIWNASVTYDVSAQTFPLPAAPTANTFFRLDLCRLTDGSYEMYYRARTGGYTPPATAQFIARLGYIHYDGTATIRPSIQNGKAMLFDDQINVVNGFNSPGPVDVPISDAVPEFASAVHFSTRYLADAVASTRTLGYYMRIGDRVQYIADYRSVEAGHAPFWNNAPVLLVDKQTNAMKVSLGVFGTATNVSVLLILRGYTL